MDLQQVWTYKPEKGSSTQEQYTDRPSSPPERRNRECSYLPKQWQIIWDRYLWVVLEKKIKLQNNICTCRFKEPGNLAEARWKVAKQKEKVMTDKSLCRLFLAYYVADEVRVLSLDKALYFLIVLKLLPTHTSTKPCGKALYVTQWEGFSLSAFAALCMHFCVCVHSCKNLQLWHRQNRKTDETVGV